VLKKELESRLKEIEDVLDSYLPQSKSLRERVGTVEYVKEWVREEKIDHDFKERVFNAVFQDGFGATRGDHSLFERIEMMHKMNLEVFELKVENEELRKELEKHIDQ